ncbi:PREDICTED: uncharacterized protein LOC105449048 [Wasmannia auropunctata]|uniref:uncharacterized protein LOC105449048 n=1 Tax=Wasmannia auropunctata TaxID=64793 RepID=UPI0005EF5655|nr:PREDICTED: uncharacterized protein LOC105449048 [Wasmannia auropunctata]
MTDEFLAWELINLEHRAEQLEHRVQRRQWRNNHDPLDLTDDKFIKLYRVSPDTVTELKDVLGPRLQRQCPSYGLSVEHQTQIISYIYYSK